MAKMKETSVYTGNTNAISTNLASVSENLCVQLPMHKKTLISKTHNRHRQKNNKNNMPCLFHTRQFEVLKKFKKSLKYDFPKNLMPFKELRVQRTPSKKYYFLNNR